MKCLEEDLKCGVWTLDSHVFTHTPARVRQKLAYLRYKIKSAANRDIYFERIQLIVSGARQTDESANKDDPVLESQDKVET